jgi:copper/silver efflux system protein
VERQRAQEVVELILAGGRVGEVRRLDANGTGSAVALPVRLSISPAWLEKPIQDLVRDATVRAGSDGRGLPVALGLLGRPKYQVVPAMLRAEKGELSGYVHVDLAQGIDLAGFVADARQSVERALGAGGTSVPLLAGERIEWTGQYELLSSGQRRLWLIVPLVVLIMLGLLYLQFRSLAEALIVLVSVPFALVGSVWTLYLLNYQLSAPVWVGLLSVVGLAIQTGVVMVVYIDDAYQRRLREGQIKSRSDIIDAHTEGTVRRLRPKLMTITTMAAGLLPIMWAQGAGSEIMKRVAAPMLGGLLTSAFLTLEVIPVLYTIWRTRQLGADENERKSLPESLPEAAA